MKSELKHKFSNDSLTQRVWSLVEQYCDPKGRGHDFFKLDAIEEKDIAARFVFKLIQSIAHSAIWRDNPKKQIELFKKSKVFLNKIKTIDRLAQTGTHFSLLIRSIEKAINYEIRALSQIDDYNIKEWLRKVQENLENVTGQMILLMHSYIQLTEKLPADLSVRITFLGEEWKKNFYEEFQEKIHISDKRKAEILKRKKEVSERKESQKTLEEIGFMEDYRDFTGENKEYSANQLLRELFFNYEKIDNETRKLELLPPWILSLYKPKLNENTLLSYLKLDTTIRVEESIRYEYLFRVFKFHVLHPDLLIKTLQECEAGVAPMGVDKDYLKKLLYQSVGNYWVATSNDSEEKTPKEIFPIFKLTSDPNFAKMHSISEHQLKRAAEDFYQSLCNLEIIATRLSLLRWSISILYEQESLIGQFGIIINAGELLKTLAQLMTQYLGRFKKELEKIEGSGYSRKIDEAINNKKEKNSELSNWNTKLKSTRDTITNNIETSVDACLILIKELSNYISEEKAQKVAEKIVKQSKFIAHIVSGMKEDLQHEWKKVEEYQAKNKKYLEYLLDSLKPVKSTKERAEDNLIEARSLLNSLTASDKIEYLQSLRKLLTNTENLDLKLEEKKPIKTLGTEKIQPSNPAERKDILFSSVNSQSAEDKDILQFTDKTLARLLENSQNAEIIYQTILSFWRQLVDYGKKCRSDTSIVDKELTARILKIHELLSKYSHSDRYLNDLARLLIINLKIPAEDSFAQLASSELQILNLKLKESRNIMKFIKNILPHYITKLESSQFSQKGTNIAIMVS